MLPHICYPWLLLLTVSFKVHLVIGSTRSSELCKLRWISSSVFTLEDIHSVLHSEHCVFGVLLFVAVLRNCLFNTQVLFHKCFYVLAGGSFIRSLNELLFVFISRHWGSEAIHSSRSEPGSSLPALLTGIRPLPYDQSLPWRRVKLIPQRPARR